MGNLTVPMQNSLRVKKTEAQVYLEHRDDAFAYLDARKEKYNASRVTPQEIVANTSVEKHWEAVTIYKEWLRNLGQEKWNNESSTKKASETTETQRQEESNPTEPTSTNTEEETIEEGTTSSPDGVGNSNGQDA